MDLNAKKKKAVELMGVRRSAGPQPHPADNVATPSKTPINPPSVASRYAHIIGQRKKTKHVY